MAGDWLVDLNKVDLIALVPPKVAEMAEREEAAARIIGNDLEKKGLIRSIPLSAAPKVKGKLYSADGHLLPAPKMVAAKKAAKKKVSNTMPASKTPVYAKLWEAIKREFYTLICTKDIKYVKLRKDLEKPGSKGTLIVVSSISSALAHYLGVAAGVCIPFVALLLMGASSVGKNAWCSIYSA